MIPRVSHSPLQCALSGFWLSLALHPCSHLLILCGYLHSLQTPVLHLSTKFSPGCCYFSPSLLPESSTSASCTVSRVDCATLSAPTRWTECLQSWQGQGHTNNTCTVSFVGKVTQITPARSHLYILANNTLLLPCSSGGRQRGMAVGISQGYVETLTALHNCVQFSLHRSTAHEKGVGWR